MMRKYQVRFGGGRMEKGPSGYLASRLPYNAFTAAARSLPDEQRYDLEVLAGQLAEHGVATYAPRPPQRGPVEPGETRSEPNNGRHELPSPVERAASLVESSIVDNSIVRLARDMFQADIVDRQPNGRRS